MNPNITKIIDQYLSGDLSSEDAKAFEQKMQSNADLRKEVELQQSIQEAAKRASLRTKVQKTGKNYHFTKTLKWCIAAITVATLAIAGYYYVSRGSLSSEIESISLELLKELDANAPIDELESQYFSIAENGEIVFTRNGVLVSVPKNAFLLNGKPFAGNVIVQVQEAMSGNEIVKAGLSTMSGDRLLETQGMFGVQGFTPEGKKLELNPKVGVYMQVPVDENKPGMQLFEGVKSADGTIDWQNPKPLAKLPILADMSNLDFYPKGYEAELDAQKWKKGKKERDSLYLSFEDWNMSEYDGCFRYSVGIVPARKMTVEESVYIYNDRRPIDKSMTEEEAIVLSKWEDCPADLKGFRRNEFVRSGEELYKRCATCHYKGKDGTGPKLIGVRQKWEEGGAKTGSIYQWVRNWEIAVKNDSYARNVSAIKPTAMDKFPELSDEDIDAIFNYVDNNSFDSDLDSKADYGYVFPSHVLAFWKPKFNKTNLATRDFEKRMQAIHQTCSNDVLALYLKQLSKGLSEIDAEVVKMGYPEFKQFADENIGKIDVDNAHLKLLQEFYSNGIAKLKESSKSDREKERKRQEKWDKEMDASRTKEASRAEERANISLMEEYNFNMENVKKQIGPSVGFTLTHGGGTIVNIDKYVMDATIARASTTITDPFTRKTAEIVYNDFKFSVAESEKYIKLFAYVFPHQLNSFQRIDGKDGNFEYPLNNDILYDIAVVGLTESGYEFYQKQSFKSGDLGILKLSKITESKLDESIEQLNNTRISKPMSIKEELHWLKKEQVDYVEQKQRMKMTEFREGIARVIFPCYSWFAEESFEPK